MKIRLSQFVISLFFSAFVWYCSTIRKAKTLMIKSCKTFHDSNLFWRAACFLVSVYRQDFFCCRKKNEEAKIKIIEAILLGKNSRGNYWVKNMGKIKFESFIYIFKCDPISKNEPLKIKKNISFDSKLLRRIFCQKNAKSLYVKYFLSGQNKECGFQYDYITKNCDYFTLEEKVKYVKIITKEVLFNNILICHPDMV